MQTKPATITVNAADLADVIWWYGECMTDLVTWREIVADMAMKVQRDGIHESYLGDAKRQYHLAKQNIKESFEQMRSYGIEPRMQKGVSDLVA
jgi:hypothetical protein